MSKLVANRVQENSTFTGTGDIALTGSTSPAMSTFASVFADGALCGYIVLNLTVQTEWEQGIGTFAAGTDSIARTYVLAGSNGTAPVDFSAGTKMVLNVGPPASAGAAYSATQVYSPGDTAVLAGTTWYALAVSKGSTPASGNPNWTALGGGGGGSGTVTSVGLSVPSWLTVANSPITTSGTLAVTAPAQAPALFLGGPASGASAAPTFRAIAATDIPTLNQSTTGSAATLTTPRTIGLSGVTAAAQPFNGSANITIPVSAIPATLLIGTASINTTGNAGSATQLATARTISGVSFNGTSNITIPFSGLGSKPTTLAGYGITDAATSAQGAEADSAVQAVVAGTNVTVDNTDPRHPVVSATGGGSGTVSADYISGLQMAWSSNTQISISSGACYIQSLSQLVQQSSSQTVTIASPSASTWYHVYAYNNSGSLAFEISSTAPAAAYFGTARSKTGDTSRRYVGSVLTDASAHIYPFLQLGNRIRYLSTPSVSPFRILSGGTSTTSVTLSASACMPITSQLIDVRVLNNSNSQVYLATPDMGSVSTSNYLATEAASNDDYYEFVTDASQNINYIFNPSAPPSTGGCNVDVMGYTYLR